MEFPKHISDCKAGELAMLDEGEIKFIDFANRNQVLLMSIKETEEIEKWSGYKPDKLQLRMSRFKTNYDGMPSLPIRIWEEKNGSYVKYNGTLTNNCKVKCACKPVNSKGKTYFNLHRDIILVEKPRETKRRRTDYFSDEETE